MYLFNNWFNNWLLHTLQTKQLFLYVNYIFFSYLIYCFIFCFSKLLFSFLWLIQISYFPFNSDGSESSRRRIRECLAHIFIKIFNLLYIERIRKPSTKVIIGPWGTVADESGTRQLVTLFQRWVTHTHADVNVKTKEICSMVMLIQGLKREIEVCLICNG